MLRSLLIATLLCSSAAFAQARTGHSESKHDAPVTGPRALTGGYAPAPRPPPPPPPPTPAPAPETAQRPHHPHHAHFGGVPGGGYWVPARVYESIDEVRLDGPGAITRLEEQGSLDDALVGRWHLIVPFVTVAEDGYGRVDTVREDADLGELIIRTDGGFEWDVPGRLRSGGSLIEVSAEYGGPGQRFWSFEGNGGSYVAALIDGTLLVYDTSNNRFFARGTR